MTQPDLSTRQHSASLLAVRATMRMLRGARLGHLPMCDGSHSSMHSLADLHSAHHTEHHWSGLFKRASTRAQLPEREAAASPTEKLFWPPAVASIALGVISVVPYNMLLQSDPGSPLFISFALHVVVVLVSLPKAQALVRGRQIPARYHLAIIVFGCLFTVIKSDAYTRLPASLCILLSNMRMIIGVAVQFALYGKKYSAAQLVGVLVVTAGIAWAAQAQAMAVQQASQRTPPAEQSMASGEAYASEMSDYLIGVLEMVASSISMVLMNSIVQIAFTKYGESVEEHIFIQHLCSLPLAFPCQWGKVGPRLHAWVFQRDAWLLFNLAASVVSTFAARSAAAQMAGRAPNLLTAQLVQTIECFLQLLLVAFLRVPPWPPPAFWGGTLVLLLGTLQYLRASDHSPKAAADKE